MIIFPWWAQLYQSLGWWFGPVRAKVSLSKLVNPEFLSDVLIRV